MHEALRQVLFTILIPLPIAAAAAFGGRRLARGGRERAGSVCFALAVVLPMPIAFLLLNGLPTESWERLGWLSLAGGAVGASDAALRGGSRNIVGAGCALAAAATILLWPALKFEESWAVRLAPGLGGGALFVVLGILGRRVGAATLLACLWAAALAAGLAVVVMGQVSMGAAVAPIGVSLLVLALALRGGNRAAGPAVLAAAACPLAAAPALAWMWMSVTGARYGLWLPMATLAAVLAAAVVLAPPVRKRRPALRVALAVAVALALGLGIVGVMAGLDRGAAGDDGLGDLPDFMRYPGG